MTTAESPRQADGLKSLEAKLGAEFIPFGPIPEAEGGVEIAATFGEYPAEYAAIRRHVGIMHLPQRGILRLTGADRQDFLHRMLTQDLRSLKGGSTRRSLQLSDKGRVLADIVVHHGDADTWLEMDRFDTSTVKTLLEHRLFTEDVAIEDFTPRRAALALYGPASIPLLDALREDGTPAAEIQPGTHHVLRLVGLPVTVYRWDDAGAIDFRLLAPTDPADYAPRLYERLLEAAGYSPDAELTAEHAAQRRASLRGRPIGWLAYNTARIEAGSPLFHIDFGSDSLPAETGLLEETTSFTKGCYIGQEVVARMKNLGHPRRVLVGLRLAGDAMPIAGSQVFDATDRATVIGAVTSSTVSPILGNAAIAFAVIKWGKHDVGSTVAVPAEGALVEAKVQALRFVD